MILCHGVNFSSQKQTSRDSLVPPDSAFPSPIHSCLPRCFPHQEVSHTLSCYVDKRNTQVTMHETKYTSYYRKTLPTFISLVNKGYTQVRQCARAMHKCSASTVDQTTNVFTKGQTAQHFQYLTNKLMVYQNPINSRGVLDYQNLQQKIQYHLHQFFTPSILLSIQNNPAIRVTF